MLDPLVGGNDAGDLLPNLRGARKVDVSAARREDPLGDEQTKYVSFGMPRDVM
jgi:hypothetical protein